MGVSMHITNHVIRASWRGKKPLLVISNMASEQQVTGQKNVLRKIEVTIQISIWLVKSSPEKAGVHLHVLRLMSLLA